MKFVSPVFHEYFFYYMQSLQYINHFSKFDYELNTKKNPLLPIRGSDRSIILRLPTLNQRLVLFLYPDLLYSCHTTMLRNVYISSAIAGPFLRNIVLFLSYTKCKIIELC